MMRRILSKLRWWSALLVLAVVGGITWAYGVPRLPDPKAPATPPYLTIFLIDGLSQGAFEGGLARGELPNIAALVRDGAMVKHGITAFPSMTGYAYFSFLTGRDAASSGVLGLRWFDRQRATGNFRNYVGRTAGVMNRDLRRDATTLYEAFDDTHSFAINTMVDRGVHHHVVQSWSFGMAKFHGQWFLPGLLAAISEDLAPTLEQLDANAVEVAIADLDNRPKIQWITLASPDARYHITGSAAEYNSLIRNADKLIGRYRDAARAGGLDAGRLYAVLSDHGVTKVDHNIDLRTALSAEDLVAVRPPAVILADSDFDDPVDDFDDADAIILVNGNTMSYVVFRNPELEGAAGFQRRLTFEQLRAYPRPGGQPVNLIALIAGVPGVELVVSTGPNGSVRVAGNGGVGLITTSDAGYAWTVAPGVTDPLGYDRHQPAQPLADGQPHDAAAWLDATHDAPFPYAIPRLAALISSPDCGDIVVTAAEGYDLGRDFEMFVGNYRGGHGGLRADQLRVPFVISGPGVRPGVVVPTARAEDIGATLFHLLGAVARRPSGESRVLTEILE